MARASDLVREPPPAPVQTAPRQLVITVHGAKSRGDWQEMAERVFTPYFRYHAVKYSDYAGVIGLLKTIYHPFFLVVAAVIFTLTISQGWHGNPGIWAAVLACLLGGFAFTRRERRRVLNQIVADIHGACLQVDRPHLIAHSMGSYFFGEMIRKFDVLSFQQIILVGSVLKRSFPWFEIIRRPGVSFRDVRNEVGTRDYVAIVAGLLGLGDAGAKGFDGPETIVHKIPGPMSGCATKIGAFCTGAVHNVSLREYGHCDQFLSKMHAQRLWLPVLWGFTPQEYEEFLYLCFEFVLLDEVSDFAEQVNTEAKLRQFVMNWSGAHGPRSTLLDYICTILKKLLLKAQPRIQGDRSDEVVNELASRAIRVVSYSVTNAILETAKGDRNTHIVLALHPKEAIMRSVESVMETS
jgi:hypothetical protein